MARNGLYPERNSRADPTNVRTSRFPKLGKYPAHQLTLHNWLTVLDRLAQGYSEITRRVISNGRQCYSWAVKRQLLETNPLSEMSGRDFGIQKQMGSAPLTEKNWR
jgi:hypothetical protein